MATFDDLLHEDRVFPPPCEFARDAVARDASVYEEASRDPVGYWREAAGRIDWFEEPVETLEWKPPHARWFLGGKLNISHNCLDRHLSGPRRHKAAIIWEGEEGAVRTMTYGQLHAEVCRFGNAMRKLGVGPGDRVAIYMPMIIEAVVAMLACARIGAVHSVVFGGFSADSLADRINDSQCRLLITADGGWRRGRMVALKDEADKALERCASVQHVVVVQRHAGGPFSCQIREGRDHWYHRLMREASPVLAPVPRDAEDLLFILYTSGTTGKPKGIVHTTGGYSVHTHETMRTVFDLRESDLFWCTADIGWVTGHSYVVYGPLQCGATILLYEGAPDFPGPDRFWKMIAEHHVTIFYTAPTAIRTFMRWGIEHPLRHNLSSLRLLGSVGEPINPEAWIWYHEHIGGNRCPIVDTWWQTETGGIMISGLPGLTNMKPGHAGIPLPGIDAAILDENGQEVTEGSGFLAIRHPWPGMLRTLYGDDDRYVRTYFSKWDKGTYFPGDGAKRDALGNIMILGRVDDVLNVSGHRIGTMEVESALVDHPAVAEAAVVGRTHDLKGQAIVAFVSLRAGSKASDELAGNLRQHVTAKIGALARPEEILFTADLPKTRSGKIMRRLLRDIADGRALGDTTTLADPNVVAALRAQYEENEGA